MKEIYSFLKDAKTYYLATLDGTVPDVRPFGTIDLFEGKLYIQTGKRKKVYRQMKANPKVSICAMLGKQWIRIAATVEEDDNIKAQEHMLDGYPELKGMYKAGDGNNVVFFLKEVTAAICSFDTDPKIFKF